MKRAILFSILSLLIITAHAQQDGSVKYPEVGLLCPNLLLTNVHYYPKSEVKIPELGNQWTVLEFWSRTCSGCIANFPKYSKLQQLYKGKVQFFLVGYEDGTKAIQPLYETYKKRLNLNLAVAFDSTIFHRMDIGGVPYAIIIDPKGIVREITTYFTEEEFADVLAGKNIELAKAWRQHELQPIYNPNKPFLLNDNGGNDSAYLYRSVLTKWNPTMSFFNPGNISSFVKLGKFVALGIPIPMLYKYAYIGQYSLPFGDSLYGQLYGNLIYETRDSTMFQQAVEPKANNAFCYSLEVPVSLSTSNYLMKSIQRDLKTYFGYDVEIQKRRVPVWTLIASNDAKTKLITKGGTPKEQYNLSPNQVYILKNLPLNRLLERIWREHQNDGIFVDETGITGNIDIQLNVFWSDLNDVKSALQKRGLDLIHGEKEMSAIVVKDPPSR